MLCNILSIKQILIYSQQNILNFTITTQCFGWTDLIVIDKSNTIYVISNVIKNQNSNVFNVELETC